MLRLQRLINPALRRRLKDVGVAGADELNASRLRGARLIEGWILFNAAAGVSRHRGSGFNQADLRSNQVLQQRLDQWVMGAAQDHAVDVSCCSS